MLLLQIRQIQRSSRAGIIRGSDGRLEKAVRFQRFRVRCLKGSFAGWLRNVPLKRDRTVRLYDGSAKSDQESQFAVLEDIEFRTAQGIRLNFGEWAAGQRLKVAGGRLVGDVFIRGGSPGHAMLVVDMGEDAAGRKIYLVAQSYMPSQLIINTLKKVRVHLSQE
jgi:hypothetical protein